MGEFESNRRYAKSIGANVSRPARDTRTTSQRITDEMNQLRKEIKWYRKWLKDIDIDGPVTGEDAEEMRRWARFALTQGPTRECITCGSTKVRHEDFKDDLSRKEYGISRMCQVCQDSVFGKA